MLERFRKAGLWWPTSLTLLGLAVLLGLGTWQMQRKAWKEGLLAEIEREVHADPGPAITRLDEFRAVAHPYRRVRLRGIFQHDQERYFYAPSPQLGAGYHVYTPLRLSDGGLIYVNRGFVPEAMRDWASRAQGQVEGVIEVVGVVREPTAKGLFTPANDPARNIWFWRDIDAMFGCTDGAPGTTCTTEPERQARLEHTTAFSVDAEAEPANPGGWPRGGTTNLNIPNRHLEYAVTWYGIAATLIGVYVAFAVGRLRAARPGGIK
jgi:surfeit locus 1 family protein